MKPSQEQMSTEPSSRTTKIRYRYRRSPDYRVVSANGAWGGLNQHSLICVDLYLDRGAVPDESIVTLDYQENRASPEIPVNPTEGEIVIIRESQVGIALTPDMAIVLGRFLLQKAEEYAQLEAQALAELQANQNATGINSESAPAPATEE